MIEDSATGKLFTTKGDANEDPDGEKVPAKDVVGKVMFSIPFIGAVVAYAKTLPGFVLFIIVPTIAIIFSEILNIKKELSSMYYKTESIKKQEGLVMKNLIVKSLIVTILLLMPYMWISNAQYLDEENSIGNTFAASSLDLQLKDTENNLITTPFFDNQKIKKDEEIEKEAKVVNGGSLAFYYSPKFEFKTGVEDVCAATNLVVERDGDEVYDGALSDFDLSSTLVQITGGEDVWSFKLKNENSDISLQGENCEFEIKFSAFQNNLSTGFSDEEKLANNIIFPYEPTISLSHNTTLHKLIISLGNLTNFLSFNYKLDYDTDTISDHIEDSVNLTGESNKTIEIDLGTESDGVLNPYPNPHNFLLNIDFTDINTDTISYQEGL